MCCHRSPTSRLRPGMPAPIRAVEKALRLSPTIPSFHTHFSRRSKPNSATARTGWGPRDPAAQDERGQVLGVAPCYLKSHSRGEYVFDRGWAEAFERAGGDY